MEQKVQKITVWGDSILKGVALGEDGKYHVLENSCGALFSKKNNIELTNRSRFGCTSVKGRSILHADLEKGVQADAVLIEYGGNDCNFDWSKISAAPDETHLPVTPVGQFMNEMQLMIDETRKNGFEPLLMTLPPLDHRRFFRTVCRGLNARNILHWLGNAFAIYRWQENYSDAVAELALQNHCGLIDVRSAFLTTKNYEAMICDDGMHPNENGHRLMAEVFDDYLHSRIQTKLAV